MNKDETAPQYPSRVHEKATPMSMRRIACLFGLVPSEVRESRVLEVGCGAGANIISLALLYPHARFKGIDESGNAIKQARSTARKLQVKNVNFEEVSLTSHEIKGRFDYIMAPGIYSWISTEARRRLLGQVEIALTDNGLAYFSYNTYPGWNTPRAVRDMMVFHTRGFPDMETKAREAKKMLNFVLANNKDVKSPYTDALQGEAALLSDLEEYWFCKEYLSEINEPVYLADFIAAANSNAMTYVGDMDLEYMYLGNYKELAQNQLGELTTAVRQEQYMDFIVNRRVRNTILSKAAGVNRSVTAARLKDFRFRLRLLPKTPISEVTYAQDVVELMSPANQDITVNVTGTERIAFVEYMVSTHPKALSMEEICTGAEEKAGQTMEKLLEPLQRFLVGGIASGLCICEREPDLFVLNPTEKPAVFAFAQHQSKTGVLVNNTRHQTIRITTVDQYILPFLDGKHEMSELVRELQKSVENGDLNISVEGTDKDGNVPDQSQIVQALVEERLRYYAVNALLVA